MAKKKKKRAYTLKEIKDKFFPNRSDLTIADNKHEPDIWDLLKTLRKDNERRKSREG